MVESTHESPESWRKRPDIENLGSWIARVESLPAQRWILPGLVSRGSVLLVTGQPKYTRKTWFCQAMALSIASGRAIPGLQAPAPARVLYLHEEGAPRATARRWRAVAAGLGVDVATLGDAIEDATLAYGFRTGWKLDDRKHRENLLSRVKTHGIEVVFVDTFTSLKACDENDSNEIQKAIGTLQKLTAANVAVVVVAHIKKEAKIDEPETNIRGSGAIDGLRDDLLAFWAKEDSQQIHGVLKRREGSEAVVCADWQVQSDRYREPQIATPTITLGEIGDPPALESLLDRSLGQGAQTVEDLSKLLRCDLVTLRKMLESCVDFGFLAKPSKGGWKESEKIVRLANR